MPSVALIVVGRAAEKDKTPAFRRGSLRFSVALSLPPRSSVLLPGAGNKPKKAVQPEKERAKKSERGYHVGPGVVDREMRAPTVRRDDDGDAAVVLTVEQTQVVTPTGDARARSVRALCGQSISLPRFRNLCDRPGPHILARP